MTINEVTTAMNDAARFAKTGQITPTLNRMMTESRENSAQTQAALVKAAVQFIS